MSAAEKILAAAQDAGFLLEYNYTDRVHRIYTASTTETGRKLVGMVIARDGKVAYSELYGRLYQWWPSGKTSWDFEAELIEQIKDGPQ
jgi:hypothetical protein